MEASKCGDLLLSSGVVSDGKGGAFTGLPAPAETDVAPAVSATACPLAKPGARHRRSGRRKDGGRNGFLRRWVEATLACLTSRHGLARLGLARKCRSKFPCCKTR